MNYRYKNWSDFTAGLNKAGYIALQPAACSSSFNSSLWLLLLVPILPWKGEKLSTDEKIPKMGDNKEQSQIISCEMSCSCFTKPPHLSPVMWQQQDAQFAFADTVWREQTGKRKTVIKCNKIMLDSVHALFSCEYFVSSSGIWILDTGMAALPLYGKIITGCKCIKRQKKPNKPQNGLTINGIKSVFWVMKILKILTMSKHDRRIVPLQTHTRTHMAVPQPRCGASHDGAGHSWNSWMWKVNVPHQSKLDCETVLVCADKSHVLTSRPATFIPRASCVCGFKVSASALLSDL